MEIFGECITDENDGSIICKCGKKDMFKMSVHMDYTDKSVSNYVCQNCGNAIQTVVRREMF